MPDLTITLPLPPRELSPVFDVFIAGVPKGQPRARAFARNMGGKVVARMYDAGTAEAWKSEIANGIRDVRPATPLDGPLAVDITFYMPRPKSLMRRKDPDGPMLYTAKPDRDNLDKAVLDALTRLSVWRDDAQVCGGSVWKWYAAKDGITGARLRVSRIQLESEAK